MIAQNRALQRSLQALTHPVTIGAVLLLLINDHVLRVGWPSWWTGKLGDAAWLAFFPLIAALVFSIILPRQLAHHEQVTVGAAFVFTTILFIAPKTIPLANDALAAVMDGLLGPRTPIRLDPSDLLVLPALGIGWWVWQRTSVLQHPDYSRHGLIICALGALATVATSPPYPPYSPALNCLIANKDKSITVLDGKNGSLSARTTDGGMTWSDPKRGDFDGGLGTRCVDPFGHTDWELIDPSNRQIVYRFRPGEGIDRSSDGGHHWILELDTGLNDAQLTYLQDIKGSYVIQPGPLNAIFDEHTGNLIVAMGQEGVAVRSSNGEWRWVEVAGMSHESLKSVESISNLLMIEILLALDLGFASFLLLKLYRGEMEWTEDLFATLAMIAWVISIFFYSAYRENNGQIFLFCMPPILLIGGITIYIFSRHYPYELPAWNVILRLLAAPILFILPFILWTQGLLPSYSVARWVGLILAGAMVIVGIVSLRREAVNRVEENHSEHS